jgi:hypothetical protein
MLQDNTLWISETYQCVDLKPVHVNHIPDAFHFFITSTFYCGMDSQGPEGCIVGTSWKLTAWKYEKLGYKVKAVPVLNEVGTSPWELMGSGCFLDFGCSWRWVVNFTLRLLYPLGKSARYPLDRSLGGPQSRCGMILNWILSRTVRV